MNREKVKKFRLPLTLAFLASVLILAMTADYNMSSVPAGAGANGNATIILDAGHGAQCLSIVFGSDI